MTDIMRMGKNPNFLGSWDLDEMPNRELILTIDFIREEEVTVNGLKELCAVCHWTDKSFKPMILNLTNRKTISKIYKTKYDEKLRGKSVIIGIERVKAFGDIYDALRIRSRVPQAPSEIVPKCDVCGCDIAAYGSMSAEQMAAYTKKKYGKRLCSICATKAAEGVIQ